MKTQIITLWMAGLSLTSCITINTDGKGSYGNFSSTNGNPVQDYAGKPMESHDFVVRPFLEISAQSGMKFFIKKAEKQKVVVNSNAPEMVVVSSENGVLNVKYDVRNAIKNVKTEVTVYTPDFEKLTATSAGKIYISDDFRLKKLAINLNSAAQIEGKIFADKLNIVATSASGIESEVNAQKINVEATSASKIKLSGITEKIDVEATSAAKVYLENLKYQNLNKEQTSLAKVYTR